MSLVLGQNSPEQALTVLPADSLAPVGGVWRRLRSNPLAVASIVVLLGVVLCAILIPILSRYTYFTATPDILARPSLRHPLGTDDTGYDILVRLAMGARVSLFVGVGVESICW